MGLPAWLAPGLQRELDRLPPQAQEAILKALRAVGDAPLKARRTRPLHASRIPHSFRVRVGPYRVLGAHLPDVGVILYTTLFQKRRPEDYARALRRHEERCLEAGR